MRGWTIAMPGDAVTGGAVLTVQRGSRRDVDAGGRQFERTLAP